MSDLLCAYRVDHGMKPHGLIHLIDVDPAAAIVGDDRTLCHRETVPDDPIHGWETCPDSMPPEGLERCEDCEQRRPSPSPQARGQAFHRRAGEVFAETDPEHWPDGRPTYGCGR